MHFHFILLALCARLIRSAPTNFGGFDDLTSIRDSESVEKRQRCGRAAQRSSWGGAQLLAAPGQLFDQVTTTMTVPDVTKPTSDQQGQDLVWLAPMIGWSMFAFAAIGNTPASGVFQAGIMANVSDDATSKTYSIWYAWMSAVGDNTVQWLPQMLPMQSNDSIRVTITTYPDPTYGTTTRGDMHFENLTQGRAYNQNVVGGAIACTSASAVVEDWTLLLDNQQYFTPLANYGTIAFTDSMVHPLGGTSVPISGTLKDLSIDSGCTTRSRSAWIDQSQGDFTMSYNAPSP